VNNLRNLALKNARTSWVLLLDADFIPSPNMSERLSTIARSDLHDSSGEKRAYVIAAFSSSLPLTNLPRVKSDLIHAIRNNTVTAANHLSCRKCHGPTNYEQWYFTTDPYEVLYKWIYEPFIMINKDRLVELFDERLKGYGFDKNTHAFALAVVGYHFIVLPELFAIHLNHPRADWDGGDIQQQLWDALKIVCEILATTKQKYGYLSIEQLFNEPIGNSCFSRDHW